MPITAVPPPDEAAKEAERQALKRDMIQIAAEMNRGLEDELKNFSRSFAEASSKAADLEQQWQRPVDQSSARAPETCYVGKWKGNNFLNGYNAAEFPKLQEKYNPGGITSNKEMTPHQFMREIQFQPDDPNLNALGSYSAQTDKIVFYTFDNQRLSPEKDYASQYRNNNPAARYVVALHEAVHKVQAKKCGLFDVRHTPANAARLNFLSENMTTTSEFLAIAQMYTNLKQQGINTFEYTATLNGKEKTVKMPTEDILDMYPGLRETITKNGFSADDPKSVRAVVEAAARHWREDRQAAYYLQHAEYAIAADKLQSCFTFSTRINCLKNEDAAYKEAEDKLLQNVFVSPEVSLDLRNYRDVINTMPKEKAKEFAHTAQKCNDSPTDEEYLAINKYLEQKGITGDKAKDEYFNSQFRNIANRTPDADQKLKKMMLGSYGEIRYADGLIETKVNDSPYTTLSEGKGDTYVVGAFVDFSAKKRPRPNENISVQTVSDDKTNAAVSSAPVQLQQMKRSTGR